MHQLRIGNAALVNGKIIIVGAIDDSGVNGYHDEGVGGTNWEFGGLLEDIHPITLTEKEVLRLGLRHFGTDGYGVTTFSLNGFNLERVRHGRSYQCTNVSFQGLGSIDVKYMHDLQNLYYDITGKELKYG